MVHWLPADIGRGVDLHPHERLFGPHRGGRHDGHLLFHSPPPAAHARRPRRPHGSAAARRGVRVQFPFCTSHETCHLFILTARNAMMPWSGAADAVRPSELQVPHAEASRGSTMPRALVQQRAIRRAPREHSIRLNLYCRHGRRALQWWRSCWRPPAAPETTKT